MVVSATPESGKTRGARLRFATIALSLGLLVVLSGCGRLGYEPAADSDADVTGTIDGSTSELGDAMNSLPTDGMSTTTGDSGPITPSDGGTADSGTTDASNGNGDTCAPKCGLGQICCQGTCYPDNPAPC